MTKRTALRAPYSTRTHVYLTKSAFGQVTIAPVVVP